MKAVDRARVGVQARFEAKNHAREAALGSARQAARRAANAIRAAHRGELVAADRLLVEARQLLDVAESVLAAHPDVYYAGFLQDAQKEYAEARTTRALAVGEALPEPEEVGVGAAPYPAGLAT